jgi:hypothetical protein
LLSPCLVSAVAISFTGFRRWYSHVALDDEFGFHLTSLGGLGLLQELSATDSLLTSRAELAHVLSVTLDLLFLGVGTASLEQSRSLDDRRLNGSLAEERRTRGESLQGMEKSVTKT